MMTKIFITATIGTLFFASAPIGGTTLDWSQFGLAGLVIGYTLWRDGQRERRMSEAIERDHKWVRETLLEALDKNTRAIEQLNLGKSKADG